MKCVLLLSLLLSSRLMAMPIYDRGYSSGETGLIYGNDDRYEVDEYVESRFVEKARSVALKVSNRKLSENRENPALIDFAKRKLKQTIPQICPSERFTEQVSLGDCSGFLIAPDLLATAGHCMMKEADCKGNKWVFDFKEGTTVLKKANVYSCKKIIAQKYVYNKAQVNDYAIIQLDRLVFGRGPLEYRKRGMIKRETPVLVIGHPMGLPMKITDGARVSALNDLERESVFNSLFLKRHYFTANIDSYAGNSGSPVFNYETGKVEGILIQGADDFVFNEEKGCLESRRFSNSAINTYEKVMRINHVPGL